MVKDTASSLKSRIGQGYLLSPLIFNITLQVIANVNKVRKINGSPIKVRNKNISIQKLHDYCLSPFRATITKYHTLGGL